MKQENLNDRIIHAEVWFIFAREGWKIFRCYSITYCYTQVVPSIVDLLPIVGLVMLPVVSLNDQTQFLVGLIATQPDIAWLNDAAVWTHQLTAMRTSRSDR